MTVVMVILACLLGVIGWAMTPSAFDGLALIGLALVCVGFARIYQSRER